MQLVHNTPQAHFISHIDASNDKVAELTILGKKLNQSFWVDADGLDCVQVLTLAELTGDVLEHLCTRRPEVVLLATGNRLRFPSADLRAIFLTRGIGLEVMSLASAARTYNVLLSEQRKVLLLALFIAD